LASVFSLFAARYSLFLLSDFVGLPGCGTFPASAEHFAETSRRDERPDKLADYIYD